MTSKTELPFQSDLDGEWYFFYHDKLRGPFPDVEKAMHSYTVLTETDE